MVEATHDYTILRCSAAHVLQQVTGRLKSSTRFQYTFQYTHTHRDTSYTGALCDCAFSYEVRHQRLHSALHLNESAVASSNFTAKSCRITQAHTLNGLTLISGSHRKARLVSEHSRTRRRRGRRRQLKQEFRTDNVSVHPVGTEHV